ncbi:MAG: polyprenyl synthetase family protein [Alphaproteobacteria bacterium]
MGVVITMRKEQAATSAMTELVALVEPEMEAVNALITRQLEHDVQLIPEVSAHLIDAGGKRLRPMLTIATSRMCGYRQGSKHITLASAVEFLHTATLLHDDVVDVSDMRRGRDTANKIWGNQAAILVGDYLISKTFQMLVRETSERILQVLADAAVIISSGEVLQLSNQHKVDATEADYLRVVDAKTAALFAAACEVSAVLADRPASEQEALSGYGRYLGIAFQLVDDVLDYRARQSDIGKAVGDDFREGKMTLPVVLAVQQATEDERKFWSRVLEDGAKHKRGDFKQALGLMEKYGTLDETVRRARDYGDKARGALTLFPDCPERTALEGIVEFCISRAY